MGKLIVAAIMAVIAALVIILAGLLSEARIGTIIMRSLAGFLLTSVAVWLVLVVLEAKNIIGFDKNIELMAVNVDDDPKSPEEYEAADELAAPSDTENKVDEVAEAGAIEAPAFAPLTSDNLRHMEPPAAS